VKQVDIPEQMQRAIARQAEANANAAQRLFTLRESTKLRRNSRMRKVLEQPSAIQLRYLQTLTEIVSEEHNDCVSPAYR